MNMVRGHECKGRVVSIGQLGMFGIGKSADVGTGEGQQAEASKQPAPAPPPGTAPALADLASKPSVVVGKQGPAMTTAGGQATTTTTTTTYDSKIGDSSQPPPGRIPRCRADLRRKSFRQIGRCQSDRLSGRAGILWRVGTKSWTDQGRIPDT